MSDDHLFALVCKLKEVSLIKLNTDDCFFFFIEDKYLEFATQTWEIRIPYTAFSLYSSIEQTFGKDYFYSKLPNKNY